MTKEPGHRTHGHAVHFSDDAAGLAAIGKTQAFDRRYNLWSVVGIGICVSSTWSAVSSAILPTLVSGGAPDFNSASYVFTNFENISGWSSDGISLSEYWDYVEAPAHFSEEMNHATRDVPRAMMYSVIGNALATFPWIIVLLFSMGSIEELVATRFGSLMPIFQIVLGATQNVKASTFLNFGIMVIAFLSAVDINGACTRTLWSMARDNAFPKIFRNVDEKWDVPIWPVVLISGISAALGCIYIGNVTAFYGIISGILVLQMTAYSIPIVLHLMQRGKVPYGPWKMPHVVGYAVNIGALCWCILGVVFFTFPIYQPVTAQNMNYSSVIFGFVLLLSAVVYLTYGKGRYIGPIKEINGIPDSDNITRENSTVGDTEMGENKDQ